MDDSHLRIPLLQKYFAFCYEEQYSIYDEEIPRPESPQMRIDWSSLPLLALKNVLFYLNRQDALAAMSTCRHWRSALLMYEDTKCTLKLRVNDIERSLFVTRIFRRHTMRLIVFVNSCEENQLDKFMNVVISLFHGSKLQEVVFVGNSYLLQDPRAVVPQLPRETVESLVLNLRGIKRFALMGCQLSSAGNDELDIKSEDMTNKQHIRSFTSHPSPSDTVLSRCNTHLMMYSLIQTLILDYEYINTSSLETLHELKMFRYLTMVIRDKPQFALERIDWLRLQTVYSKPLKVTVCLLQLSNAKIEEVRDNVFVLGLKLVSLKAMFCKTMHLGAIIQVSKMFKNSLQEFVWTDAPYEGSDYSQRSIRSIRMPEFNMCNVNPLILMCWQCARLKRVVVHGYWIWQYDVVGMVRLRRGLHLELSSVCGPKGRGARCPEGISRVLTRDPQWTCEPFILQQISEDEEMVGWIPMPWSHLHPGLRADATQSQRADYVLLETRTPFGVTIPYAYWRRR